MKEIWREHESGLLVSNLGQIFVPKSGGNKEHYTYGSSNDRGYKHVTYNKIPYQVSSLVFYTFHPERDEDEDKNNKLQVNHINENTSDNRLENLNIMTPRQNANWGTRNKRIAEKNYKPVLQYDPNWNLIKEWSNITLAAKELNIFKGNIVKVCRYKDKTAGGFIWRYKE